MLPPNADMLSVGTNREALESSTIRTTKANTSEAIPFKESLKKKVKAKSRTAVKMLATVSRTSGQCLLPVLHRDNGILSEIR